MKTPYTDYRSPITDHQSVIGQSMLSTVGFKNDGHAGALPILQGGISRVGKAKRAHQIEWLKLSAISIKTTIVKTILPFLLVILSLLLVPPTSLAGPPDIRVAVKPEGRIWVGQRATLSIDLISSTWFSGTPEFDLPDMPGAIVLKVGTFAVNSSEVINGETYSIQGHEFALFLQKPGDIVIPSFNVRFYSATPGGGKPKEINAKTPELKIKATMPPGAKKLSTIISTTKLKVSEQWDPKPEKANVGDAFTRTITIRADDVLGMAFTPIKQDVVSGMGVYFKDPVVSDKLDRGNFIGKRIETITYICEDTGNVTLPEISIHWWDMENETLKTETLASVQLNVKPNPALIKETASPSSVVSGIPFSAGIIIGCIITAAGLLYRFRLPLKQKFREWRKTRRLSEKVLFKQVKSACRSGDNKQIYTAFTKWLNCFSVQKNSALVAWFLSQTDNEHLKIQIRFLNADLFGKPFKEKGTFLPKVFIRELNTSRKRCLKQNRTSIPVEYGLDPLNPTCKNSQQPPDRRVRTGHPMS